MQGHSACSLGLYTDSIMHIEAVGHGHVFHVGIGYQRQTMRTIFSITLLLASPSTRRSQWSIDWETVLAKGIKRQSKLFPKRILCKSRTWMTVFNRATMRLPIVRHFPGRAFHFCITIACHEVWHGVLRIVGQKEGKESIQTTLKFMILPLQRKK